MAQNRAVSNQKAEELKLTPERINHYLTNPKICEDRSAIAKLPSKLEMHIEISKKPAEESLPVILQILIQIKTLLTTGADKDAEELADTLAVVENTITILGETDKVQRGSLGDKKAYIKKLLDEAKITGKDPFIELEHMVKDVARLEMTESTVKLWGELSIWMEGLYQRTAKNIKERDAKTNEPMRDKKGYYPRVDAEDFAIYMVFSVTKMDISIHYHRASVNLDEKIDKFKPKRKPSQMVVESPAKTASRVALATAAANDGSIDYKMEVEPSVNNGFITLKIDIPEGNADYAQTICETVEEMFSNPLVTEMRKHMHRNDEARISAFESLLTQFKLSPLQKIQLGNFKLDAVTELNTYVDPATLSWMNPLRLFGRSAPLPGFLDKVNAPLADEALNNLNRSTDVIDHINVIIKLRRQLKETHSTNLRPAITKLLIDTIERICPAPTPRLERETSIADLSRTAAVVKMNPKN